MRLAPRARERAREGRALVYRWRARLSGRRVGLVLVYHGVARERGRPETDIVPVVTAADLEDHVQHLARAYHVVPPSRMLGAVASRRRGQRIPVALTFDDDLSSHAALAAPILTRHAAPAAFFVCGASLEGPHRFWWEDLQHLLDARALDANDLSDVPPSAVAAALAHEPGAAACVATMIEELGVARRAAVARRLREAAGPPSAEAGLRGTQVASLVAGGFEVGFHTLRHDRLPPLGEDELRSALQEGRDGVAVVCGGPLTAISYPHGRADGRVRTAAQHAGFVLGFTGAERVVEPHDDPLQIPRIRPREGSRGTFAVQMARFALGRHPSRRRFGR